MEKPIYPEIRITRNTTGTELFTFLRKMGTNKKWYLMPFRREVQQNPTPEEINNFHAEVYRFLIATSINKEFLDKNIENGFCELDTNQESERDRIERITL